jgi:hypothetical protein
MGAPIRERPEWPQDELAAWAKLLGAVLDEMNAKIAPALQHSMADINWPAFATNSHSPSCPRISELRSSSFGAVRKKTERERYDVGQPPSAVVP